MFRRLAQHILVLTTTVSEQKMLLGGVSEVAEALGVSRQRLAALRNRRGFPAPVADLSSGPVWDLEQIARWRNASPPRSAGRPPKSKKRTLDDRFELEDDPIGSGGYADVYRALDLEAAVRGEDS